MTYDLAVGKKVQEIANDLQEGFGSDPLLSKGAVRIVGSLYDVPNTGQAPSSATYDLDVVMYLPNITDASQQAVESLFEDIAENRTCPSIRIIPKVAHGLEKVKAVTTEQRLLLHGHIYNEACFSEQANYILLNFRRFGTEVFSTMPPEFHVDRVGLNDVLQGPYSPGGMKNILSQRTRQRKIPTADGFRYESVKVEEVAIPEICIYGVMSNACNTLSAIGPYMTVDHFERDSRAAREFSRLFPGFSGKDLPSELFDLRRRFRDGSPVSMDGIEDMALCFLTDLERMAKDIIGSR